MTNRGTKW